MEIKSICDFNILICRNINLNYQPTRWRLIFWYNLPVFKWSGVICKKTLFYRSKEYLFSRGFWRSCSKEQFYRLRKYPLGILSLFGRTYICESVFFAMSFIKLKLTNRIGWFVIEIVHLISQYRVFVDVEKLIFEKQF